MAQGAVAFRLLSWYFGKPKDRAVIGLFLPPDEVLKILLPNSAFVAFPQISASLEAIGGSRQRGRIITIPCFSLYL